MSALKNATAQAKLRVETARARYGWFDVAISTFKRFSEGDGGFYAAGLTYYAFFSVFPLVLFAVSALGFVAFLSQELKQDLLDAGRESFPLIGEILTINNLNKIEDARFSLAAVGLLLVLYSGTGGIVAFEHALNRIHGVSEEGTFFQKRMRSLRFLGAIGVIALASVAFGAVWRFIDSPVVSVFAFLAGFGTSVLLFASAFRFLPQANLTWSEVLPGAVVAGAIFEVLKIVGPTYLASGEEGRNATFGAFAAAAGLLISAFLLCQVALLAAQLNAVLAERRQSREFSLANKDKEAP
ncbi:MAG: YihY/virulence factor BrkB family protein [Actinomycetota bacterium]